MTFEEILDQAMAMLQRRGRLTYGTLKRQFQLDDAALEDLKNELIEGQRLAVDEEGNVLVWTGAKVSAPHPTAPPVSSQDRPPLAYTPQYLAEKVLKSRSALEGERKQVTVLFADLKGSMELLADRDPEEARQLLDPVLERMMAAVHRYEGTVNQVMGDGIMALFGAPLAHEDHAVRACYAALAMQAAVKQYAAEVQRTKGVPLQMRVGVNAGEVVVRAIGTDLHMDYSAIGQTTHLAARMEQMAMPGSILVTQAVLGFAEGYVQVKPLGLVPVKGLSAPVEVFELVGASGIRRRLQATAVRGLTRFVGRDMELTALVHALARAGAGHGQVVALVGEAGVGKSRLVYEFMHSHHTQGWRVLESTSVSYGKATPYFPVIDLLRRYAHVEERDDPRTIRAKMTGQVLTLDESLQDTIPALLSLLDALLEDSPFLQLDPPQRRQRTLDALKRLLVRESQVQPLLLVFEDLHWIDAETQALLDSVVSSLPTARLLLLVNYRPEYQHGWGSKTYYAQLRLDPLPPASAAAVLRALLGADPSLEPLTQLLIARTAGNPFFLEESVRTLVETGVLVGERGAYQLAQAVPNIQIPATVQAVLAARIDRLPPEKKSLLQTAAVIGTEVPFLLLQTIAEMPEGEMRLGLAHLQAAEFLYETHLFPELVYTFKHALTHEVAYRSLLQERRRAIHAQIATAIEELYPDRLREQVERLAHHALRGEVWVKAARYARQAAEKAKERYAFASAMQLITAALEAAARGTLHEERLRTLVLHGDLHSLLGNLVQANQSYEQALQAATDVHGRRWIENKRHRPQSVTRGGGRIAFYEHGTGDTTLLLWSPLVYGLAAFQPLIEKLCQEFRIITLDARGTGSSDPLQRPYSVKDHMEDTRTVMEAAASGCTVAIGHSRGCRVLLKLVVAYPTLVQKLVLVGGSVRPLMARDWQAKAHAHLERGEVEEALRLLMSTVFSEPETLDLAEQCLQAALRIPVDTVLNFFDPDPEADVEPLLPSVRVPTLVMHGTEDRIALFAEARYLAEQIPGAQLYGFRGKGHNPVLTAIHEFCEVLRRFVRTGRISESTVS